MPGQVDGQEYVRGLHGRTLRTPARGRANVVLGFDERNVIVGTERSPGGERVALRYLQQGLDILFDEGEVRITPGTFGGYRRSSAVGALLASLDRVETEGSPTRVTLSPESPLRDGFEQACRQVAEGRVSDKVLAEDPLYRTLVHDIPGSLRTASFYGDSYKVQGSAGQTNFPWAETGWVAVFDRLVTSSAQQGHYLVYLVHPKGAGVFLSLNQAVTEARAAGIGNLKKRLTEEAVRLRAFISPEMLTDLIVEPLDLAGKGIRTRGYEAANVAARFYSAGEIPHDAALLADVARFLGLYEQTTTGLDEANPAIGREFSVEAPPRTREESRRYRWHLRAEGRNSRLARAAKEIQGYRCCACGRNYVEELGPVGRRCVDAHHLTPFHEMNGRPVALDPRSDFAIVCSNCHRLVHSEIPPLRPEDVSRLLRDKPATD